MQKRLRGMCRNCAQSVQSKWAKELFGEPEAGEDAQVPSPDGEQEESQDAQVPSPPGQVLSPGGNKEACEDTQAPSPGASACYYYGFDHDVKKPWRSADATKCYVGAKLREFGVLVQPSPDDDGTDPAEAKFSDGTVASITQITKAEATEMMWLKTKTKGFVLEEIQGRQNADGVYSKLTIGKKKDHKPLLALYEKDENPKRAICHLVLDQIGDPTLLKTVDSGVEVLAHVAKLYAKGEVQRADINKAKKNAMVEFGFDTKVEKTAPDVKTAAPKKDEKTAKPKNDEKTAKPTKTLKQLPRKRPAAASASSSVQESPHKVAKMPKPNVNEHEVKPEVKPGVDKHVIEHHIHSSENEEEEEEEQEEDYDEESSNDSVEDLFEKPKGENAHEPAEKTPNVKSPQRSQDTFDLPPEGFSMHTYA